MNGHIIETGYQITIVRVESDKVTSKKMIKALNVRPVKPQILFLPLGANLDDKFDEILSSYVGTVDDLMELLEKIIEVVEG